MDFKLQQTATQISGAPQYSIDQIHRYLQFTQLGQHKKRKKRRKIHPHEDLYFHQLIPVAQIYQPIGKKDQPKHHKTYQPQVIIQKPMDTEIANSLQQLPEIQMTQSVVGRQTTTNGFSSFNNDNERQLQQLLKESKMLQTKIKFFNYPREKKDQNFSTAYGGQGFFTNKKPSRDLSMPTKLSNQSQSKIPTVQTHLPQNSRKQQSTKISIKNSKNLSFLEVNSSIEERISEKHLMIADSTEKTSLQARETGSMLLYQSDTQYKLPSIKSNDNFNREEDFNSKLNSSKNYNAIHIKMESERMNPFEAQEVIDYRQNKQAVPRFEAKQRLTMREVIEKTTKISNGYQGQIQTTVPTVRKQTPKLNHAKGPSQNEEQALTLTDEEKQLYGNRFPKDYQRIKLLGRGGCALVWLAKDQSNEGREVAIKQFPKANGQNANLQSGYKELLINQIFFGPNGALNQRFLSETGLATLCKLLDSKDEKQDLWLVFELCGRPLSKSVFEVKGEFFKGERIYSVIQRERIFKIFEQNGCEVFKEFVRSITRMLNIFQTNGIVHSDLKPENILIKINNEGTTFDYKIIDLGSSFHFSKVTTDIDLTTPEYLSPDILEYLESKQGSLVKGQGSDVVDQGKKLLPHSIDVWSFGAILLELVVGFPLWLSYKGRIVKAEDGVEDKTSGCMTGLFGIQGRTPKKIMQKQIYVVKNLRHILKKQFDSNLCLGRLNVNEEFLNLLSSMLDLNPRSRISPQEILSHPFLS